MWVEFVKNPALDGRSGVLQLLGGDARRFQRGYDETGTNRRRQLPMGGSTTAVGVEGGGSGVEGGLGVEGEAMSTGSWTRDRQC